MEEERFYDIDYRCHCQKNTFYFSLTGGETKLECLSIASNIRIHPLLAGWKIFRNKTKCYFRLAQHLRVRLPARKKLVMDKHASLSQRQRNKVFMPLTPAYPVDPRLHTRSSYGRPGWPVWWQGQLHLLTRRCTGANPIKLFTAVILRIFVRVFIPGKAFQPSLMFSEIASLG